jgi:hypothetical protein
MDYKKIEQWLGQLLYEHGESICTARHDTTQRSAAQSNTTQRDTPPSLCPELLSFAHWPALPSLPVIAP